MNQEQAIIAFEKHSIRRFFDEARESWYFSVVDVVAALTDSVNPRDYWFKMKIRVKTEAGFELSTICRQLKMKAPDGKMRETDCADADRIIIATTLSQGATLITRNGKLRKYEETLHEQHKAV